MQPTDLLAIPYRLVRTPLAILDFQLTRRLSENSLAVRTLQLALGSADHLAGWVLQDASLSRITAEDVAAGE